MNPLDDDGVGVDGSDHDATVTGPTDEPERSSLGAKIVTVAIGLLLIGLIAVLATRDTDQSGADSSPLLGRVVPALTGTTLAGDTFDIDDARGSWVLLNFFASWCIPCEQEHPELVEFARRHDDGTATVVSVTMGDKERDARAFFEDHGGDWPVIIDAEAAPATFVVLQVPESFLIAPSGVVVGKWNGQITADSVDEVIARYTEPA